MSTYYGTESAFNSYRLARGLPAATGNVPAALLVASEWIDNQYRGAWMASGTVRAGGRDQEREWPREGFVDAYGYSLAAGAVPREVENATYEAAARELAEPGSLWTDFKASESYKQVSVDGAISVTFNGSGTVEDAQIVIPIVRQILAPLLGKQSSGYSGASVRV